MAMSRGSKQKKDELKDFKEKVKKGQAYGGPVKGPTYVAKKSAGRKR